MFGEMGGYEICSVCFWEDDLVQVRRPSMGWGANAFPLIVAQQNYWRFGAMEERFRKKVQQPKDDQPLDPGRRPIDPTRDSFEEAGSSAPWPEDLTALYWWRPTFWQRSRRPAAGGGPRTTGRVSGAPDIVVRNGCRTAHPAASGAVTLPADP
ncbi:CPCC family cysteine-rich protein [Streptomyces sp. AA1529]|uniref:CPCC family cysteine-rich protein n=1 Tax=Streptomyces sp. AA1529 TaxID=1203257 RepID=UPI003D7078CD